VHILGDKKAIKPGGLLTCTAVKMIVNAKKKGLGAWHSGRMSAQQAQGPEFRPQHCQKLNYNKKMGSRWAGPRRLPLRKQHLSHEREKTLWVSIGRMF
jgi:hypothetical protein